MQNFTTTRLIVKASIALVLLFLPSMAYAYIGPGAGFAFVGSTFVFILALLMGFITLVVAPVVWVVNRLSGKGIPKSASARRVVIIGLDGLDPTLTERFIVEGRLPNLKKLSESGSYRRLATTLPAISPVAWATFQTGVNPGAHNIFDFLTRDKRFCLPELSSSKTVVEKTEHKFGPFSWDCLRPQIKLLRKSKPFWYILGKHGIFSNILRVPISYPPEKFNGNILSAMCTPDLRGTQGSFTLFSTRAPVNQTIGGWFSPLCQIASDTSDRVFEGIIDGPTNPNSSVNEKTLTISFKLRVKQKENSVKLTIGDKTVNLEHNQFSEWIELDFKVSRWRKISGIVRFCLRDNAEHVTLYMSPINANPARSVLPISYPIFFAQWLAKRSGLFGTLGLMEDTWGRNELALDDQRFLDQTYFTHAEREKMLFDTLERTREGLCVCVFDATDRIQHMFWRYLEDGHPSPRENVRFDGTIQELYERMDGLVGRIQSKLAAQDLLLILSDHGFSSFRRGVNLNSWLRENGYLVLKDGASSSADYFAGVDWSKTKAFAVGLTGLYINQKGREHNGIVEANDSELIKQEIVQGLERLCDPRDGVKAIRKVYDSRKEYHGLYADEAPDLIMGYAAGYRVSWDCVTGGVEENIFSDNVKAWSGDHHIDPPLVPGVLFCNRILRESDAHIRDIAPTVLSVFSLPVPSYMEGKSLL